MVVKSLRGEKARILSPTCSPNMSWVRTFVFFVASHMQLCLADAMRGPAVSRLPADLR